MDKFAIDQSAPDYLLAILRSLSASPALRHKFLGHLVTIVEYRLHVSDMEYQEFLERLNTTVNNFLLTDTSIWTPMKDAASEQVSLQLTKQKIQQVLVDINNEQVGLEKLKLTTLGSFYARHIKKRPFARQIASWMWRHAYPIYINHVANLLRNRSARRWRPLTTLSEFTSTRKIQKIEVAKAVQIEVSTPKIFPASDQDFLTSPHNYHNFPSVYVAMIGEGVIYGGSNLVLTKNEVICHDLYNFERDYTSEELHGRHIIDPIKHRIRCLLSDEAPENIADAAVFVDACASNYAHWITEVLTRIAAFCSLTQFKDIPIVINDGLHKNILESLLLVTGPDRKIITLPIGRALSITNLYLTSVAGYVPFEPRGRNIRDRSHGLFSPDIFALLQRSLSIPQSHTKNHSWPEMIFLRRNSGARNLANGEEIENLLTSKGFVIIVPEKLTFTEQVQVFSRAKIIVGATGATFSNGIFCRPGTNILILIAKHREMVYEYWGNMLSPRGVNLHYVFGNLLNGHENSIHGDFEISPLLLNDALENIKCK